MQLPPCCTGAPKIDYSDARVDDPDFSNVLKFLHVGATDHALQWIQNFPDVVMYAEGVQLDCMLMDAVDARKVKDNRAFLAYLLENSLVTQERIDRAIEHETRLRKGREEYDAQYKSSG